MTRRAAALLVLCGALVPGAAPARAQEAGGAGRASPRAVTLAGTVRTTFPLAAWRVVDVDRDGADDLLAVGEHGEVRVWRRDGRTGRLAAEPAGVLVLPEPSRSALAIADVLGTGGPPQLAVVSSRGLEAYPVGPDGSYARAPVLVSGAATLGLRVGRPTWVDLLRDLNGDGRPDLLLPRGDACGLWLWTAPPADAPAGTLPEYREAGSFRIDVARDRVTDAGALSDVLESGIRIPSLTFRDVNGDGRRDLLVEDGKLRAFHLAREDGTVPREPDVRVDLAKFVDTTADAEVRLGRTLAGEDDQRLESADLDGDGIPDWVVSHRRKLWVFLGTTEGPKFDVTPRQVLKVADDVSAMLVAPLDGDPHPDLLLLRVQVPTIATLLKGLVASWDVEITAAAYGNDGTGKFATTPRRKGDVALRLPAILGILRDPDALVRKFERLASKLDRGFVWGDFDGDGEEDAAEASGTERRLDVWFAVGPRDGGGGGASDLDGIFFGGERVWDLERVLQWLGDYADRRFAQVTGNRPPSARAALRPEGEAFLEGAAAGRLDGGPAATIVVVYIDAEGRGLFDLWR